ncbi:MAG: hypothetical protein RLZZ592_1137 [Pseudomonadota bacterium]
MSFRSGDPASRSLQRWFAAAALVCLVELLWLRSTSAGLALPLLLGSALRQHQQHDATQALALGSRIARHLGIDAERLRREQRHHRDLLAGSTGLMLVGGLWW